jgi:hypothetical protein
MAQRRTNGHGQPPSTPRLFVNVAVICRGLDQGGPEGPTIRGVITGATIGVSERARKVDRFEVESEVFLVIHVHGGQPGQFARVRVDTEGTDGLRRDGTPVQGQFTGAEGSLRMPATLRVAFWGEQRYWFNVVIDGRLITRVPFDVRYEFLPDSELPHEAHHGTRS